LRVVTPLLKSGGYRLTSKIQQTGTNTMTITASEDLPPFRDDGQKHVNGAGGWISAR
jgi:hypothetical protein